MLSQIAFYPIMGKPLIMYGGIMTWVLLVMTAAAAKLTWRGQRVISFKGHVWLAYVALALSVIHGVLGIGTFF